MWEEKMENIAQADAAAEMGNQYSLAKILGIWALAAIPLGIVSWVVFPAVSPDVGSDPLTAGVTRIVLLTVGLIWLFVLSMIIVWQEEKDALIPSGFHEGLQGNQIPPDRS